MSNKTFGIDISKHNGLINWDALKNSKKVDYAIIRAGYGKLLSQKDINFERNYSEAKRVGIPVGCYWYSYAKTVSEAQTEARVFLKAIEGKQFEYPVYLDFEEESQFKLGRSTCSAMAKAFLEIIEKAGYFTGIYSSKSGLENYIDTDTRKKYSVWVAHVNVNQTTYSMPFDMWQFTWKGKIDGISGDVDCNYCYKDFSTIIKNAGLNGFTKASGTVKDSNVIINNDKKEDKKETIKITLEIDGVNYTGTLEKS